MSKRSHPNLTKKAKQQEVKAPKTSMERKIRHRSRAIRGSRALPERPSLVVQRSVTKCRRVVTTGNPPNV